MVKHGAEFSPVCPVIWYWSRQNQKIKKEKKGKNTGTSIRCCRHAHGFVGTVRASASGPCTAIISTYCSTCTSGSRQVFDDSLMYMVD